MHKHLLYMKTIPIDVIQEKVSKATGVPVDEMLMPDRVKGARKRERVMARQISMTISKNLTSYSLGYIGLNHGGHDHATVLHASKQISNLLDTKEKMCVDWYNESIKSISIWEYEQFIIENSQEANIFNTEK